MGVNVPLRFLLRLRVERNTKPPPREKTTHSESDKKLACSDKPSSGNTVQREVPALAQLPRNFKRGVVHRENFMAVEKSENLTSHKFCGPKTLHSTSLAQFVKNH